MYPELKLANFHHTRLTEHQELKSTILENSNPKINSTVMITHNGIVQEIDKSIGKEKTYKIPSLRLSGNLRFHNFQRGRLRRVQNWLLLKYLGTIQ